jgi:hypothetical protein
LIQADIIPTLKLLCRSGQIPGARLEKTPFGRDYWTIPESSLCKMQLRPRGRPSKQVRKLFDKK